MVVAVVVAFFLIFPNLNSHLYNNNNRNETKQELRLQEDFNAKSLCI